MQGVCSTCSTSSKLLAVIGTWYLKYLFYIKQCEVTCMHVHLLLWTFIALILLNWVWRLAVLLKGDYLEKKLKLFTLICQDQRLGWHNWAKFVCGNNPDFPAAGLNGISGVESRDENLASRSDGGGDFVAWQTMGNKIQQIIFRFLAPLTDQPTGQKISRQGL